MENGLLRQQTEMDFDLYVIQLSTDKLLFAGSETGMIDQFQMKKYFQKEDLVQGKLLLFNLDKGKDF